MLEGTELSHAYASLSQQFEEGVIDAPVMQQSHSQKTPKLDMRSASASAASRQLDLPSDNVIAQTLAAIQHAQPKTAAMQQPPVHQAPPQVARAAPQYDMSVFNKQFEQEQKINALVNELKKQKVAASAAPAPQYFNHQGGYDESYWDKLVNKRKELAKFVQSGLIILFAISLHFIIDFLLKAYLQANDVSYNREVLIRVLYPVGILFVAWNIITFIK